VVQHQNVKKFFYLTSNMRSFSHCTEKLKYTNTILYKCTLQNGLHSIAILTECQAANLQPLWSGGGIMENNSRVVKRVEFPIEHCTLYAWISGPIPWVQGCLRNFKGAHNISFIQLCLSLTLTGSRRRFSGHGKQTEKVFL
jgi:hypothetical protein